MGKKHEADYQICIQIAKEFYRISKGLYLDPNYIVNSFYSYVITTAFSCELYIKAIILHRSSTSEYGDGHDLKELFTALPSDDQDSIINTFEQQSSHKFLDFLEASKNAFVDWRYAMENKVSICTSDLMLFAETLDKYISKLS